jgi:ParB-like chromosome segregation protein Spo0J
MEKLIPHPENPNRMGKGMFKKLTAHIERTGNYEPVIVRVDPQIEGSYQILNGHHRVKALKTLDIDKVDCVVWDVEDDESLVLLATLNRLVGNDELERKRDLFKNLMKRIELKELSKQLPDNKKSIQRLASLIEKPVVYLAEKPLLLDSMVFFLDEKQTELVERALAKAGCDGSDGTRAQNKATAIIKISEAYLNN